MQDRSRIMPSWSLMIESSAPVSPALKSPFPSQLTHRLSFPLSKCHCLLKAVHKSSAYQLATSQLKLWLHTRSIFSICIRLQGDIALHRSNCFCLEAENTGVLLKRKPPHSDLLLDHPMTQSEHAVYNLDYVTPIGLNLLSAFH